MPRITYNSLRLHIGDSASKPRELRGKKVDGPEMRENIYRRGGRRELLH